MSVPFQISCGECGPCRQGPHRELCGRGVHVQLRLRARGRAVGRVPGPTSCAFPTPSTCSCLSPRVWTPAAVASASDNISDAWRAVGAAPHARAGRGGAGGWGRGPRFDRSVCGRAGGRARGRVGGCTSTPMHGAATRRASSARRRWPSLPKRLGPFPITVDSERRPRRSFAGAALDGAGWHLHEHRDLLRRAALATAAGDVHEGHHVHDRAGERPRGHASRARASRHRADVPRSSSPRALSAGRTRPTRWWSATGRSS